jgi:hypothetical protein
MTQNIFNLYSASIFAEHPSALWTLDDDFSYLSLVSSSAWTLENLQSSSVQAVPDQSPLETVGVGEINLDIENFSFSSSATLGKLEKSVINSPENIDIQKRTACVSSYIYTYDSDIKKITIGFKYKTEDDSSWRYDVSEFENIEQNSWKKISHTFDALFTKILGADEVPEGNELPEGTEFIELNLDTEIYPIVWIELNNRQSEDYFSLYNFSVGQWSEQYNYETIGSTVTPLTGVSSSSIFTNSLSMNIEDVPQVYLREADPYGFSNSDIGYYWVYNNTMLATNSKMPMVFGSGNITELKSVNSITRLPSVSIPGKGFLHNNGKYKELTAEFWLRINNDSQEERKIFGPLSSNDGLYVEDQFIKIKVAQKEQSYYIGKWYRPMLIDFTYNPFFVSLLINGDEVASFEITPRDTIFPEDPAGSTNDWLGFFCYEDTQPFEIDAVAIYPYIVSKQAAKRKFVYGQGVGKSEEIVQRFGGISTTIDFPFADYTKNVIYPDMTRWDSGFYSNVNATSRFLSLPEYELPEFTYVGEDLRPFTLPRIIRTWGGVADEGPWENWRTGVWRSISATREANPLVDNYDLQSEREDDFYVKLTPSSVYEGLFGALSFKTMNPINDPVSSVLGIFSINSTEPEDIANDSNILTLMHFKNRATGDSLDISIEIIEDESGNPLQYFIDYEFNGVILERQPLDVQFADTLFIAGIDVEKFSNTYRSTIRNFFSIPQNISLNVGGQDRNEFPGKIYRITFNNKFFTDKDLGNYFRETGAAKCKCNVTPNYFDTFLKYIGNYTLLFKKANSSMIMDIGSVGYWEDSIPLSALGSYIKDRAGETKYYDLDLIQFNIDVPTSLYAEGILYEENEQSDIDVYATIQKFEDVGGINYSNYSITKELGTKRYVDFDDPQDNIDITKYRLVDGTIAFPPKTKVNFADAYLTLHAEVRCEGVKTSPVKIQRMSIASLAFDQSTLYPLSSPTGNKFYPFTRQSASYSNKIKNPFIIYKDSTPYLYLTSDSGIYTLPYPELVSASSNYSRGLSLAINPKRKSDYKIYGFHAWMNYNEKELITERKQIFSIYSNDRKTNFYIEPEDTSLRAKNSSIPL